VVGGASIVVGGLAALAAIALNVLPYGEWASRHNALFERWTDLREDVDKLLFEIEEVPTTQLVDRLKELEGKFHRICGTEPGYKKPLLDECYREEETSRRFAAALSQ